ncbi:MAG: hypothetical protein KKE39_14505 [Bacteroidetes bacterium]|nr:hypothetical protein [Bacteroidota bacterium]MBU1373440.1 hypothetical protein [Bacteroidota bacterium]MBU1483700.1 hypothetical protein [Bacteroidota bacterium]MBU1761417.1 hypothetical protein [Bacteroidota bacterium]MBU2268430.1 hypothetical protein [Bacteroidota bacterium]
MTQNSNMMNEIKKSVQSINPFKSVIQTSYDIVKAHGGEIKIGNPKPEQVGTTFIITLPLSNQTL